MVWFALYGTEYSISSMTICVDIIDILNIKLLQHIDYICNLSIKNIVTPKKSSFNTTYTTYTTLKKINNTCSLLRLYTDKDSIHTNRDIMVDIYYGNIALDAIPIHYMVYLEHIVNDCIYYIAIETYIRSKTNIQIFIEKSEKALFELLQERYTSYKIELYNM